jgi:hypothetical protein
MKPKILWILLHGNKRIKRADSKKDLWYEMKESFISSLCLLNNYFTPFHIPEASQVPSVNHPSNNLSDK